MKKFLTVYFTSLAVCTICVTALDRHAFGRTDVIVGVGYTNEDGYTFGHSPFKSVAECRASAKEFIQKNGQRMADAGLTIGCASIEMQP